MSGYPDTLPELTADPLEGEIDEEELGDLLNGLKVLVRPLACDAADRLTSSRAKKTLEWL